MMLVNGAIDPSRPAETGARRHHDAGWPVFQLPHKDKFPPPPGTTGWSGVDADVRQIDRFTKNANVGLRMPHGVMGIDVDHYDKKSGGTTLLELEARLGALPESPVLTSRDDGVSGIRFFSVPQDTVLTGVLGPGIEVIQRHHRYAVAAGSVHPKTGKPYRWLFHGDEIDAIPRVADLNPLPTAWIEQFRTDVNRGGEAATSDAVESWLRDHDGTKPCEWIKRLLRKVYDEAVTVGESRHDSMCRAQWAIISAAMEGHSGGSEALEGLADQFYADLDGENRDAEFEFGEALAGAIGKVMASPPAIKGCCVRPGTVEFEVVNRVCFAREAAERMHELPGVYRRGAAMVRIFEIGSDGYVAPKAGSDGPAQVHPLDAVGLRTVMHTTWDTFRWVGGDREPVFAPMESLSVLLSRTKELERLPEMTGTTHTPVLRPDGSVLMTPGYDPATGLVYLPPAGLTINVPDKPTARQVKDAIELLEDLISEFPWVSEADRINFLGGWLSPVMMPVIAEPGPMLLINAPMMGSGKTYLADILDATHGAVKRPPLVRDDTELSKRIVAVLDKTTAPVVVFDNCAEPIGSPVLAAVLTSNKLSERILGKSEDAELSTRRLWVATGNNITLAGDMARRGLWASIDPRMPQPWTRTGYKYNTPAGHVRRNRGDYLSAILTLARAWALAGMPQNSGRTDSAAQWFGVTTGVLQVAGLTEIVGNTREDQEVEGVEDDELGGLLAALRDEFGAERFKAGDAARSCIKPGGGYSDLGHALPIELHDKLREVGWLPDAISKSLGRYFQRNKGRWTANGFCLVLASDDRKNGHQWKVVTDPSKVLAEVGGFWVSGASSIQDSQQTPRAADVDVDGGTEKGEGSEETPETQKPPRESLLHSHAGTTKVVYFDLETGSAERLWQGPPNPEFVRLGAFKADDGPVKVTGDPIDIRWHLENAETLVGHNIYDYDLKVLARHYGLDYEALLAKSVDTMVLSRLVWPVEARKPPKRPEHGHGLDELTQRFLGLEGKAAFGLTPTGRERTLTQYAQACNRTAKLADKYMAIPTDDPRYRDYCAQDVELLAPLYEAIQAHDLYDENYAARELEYMRSLHRMSWRGFQVDEALIAERILDEEARVATARAWFHDHGIEVKKDFSKAGKAAYGQMLESEGFNVPRTETGDYSASYEALREAGVEHESLEYLRMITSARGLPSNVDRCLADDGRVHVSVQASQASGRLSATNPPLTTFGAREHRNLTDRDMFVARDRHLLFSCDLSSIDVRGMAWHARDAAMIERLQPGKDWHTEMAQLVFSDPARRKDAKPLSHAVNYNAGPRTIAENAEISEPEAARIIATMASALPDLWAFKERVGRAAEVGQYVQNGWGRWMRPDRSRAFTTAPGLSGQGWARDALAECQLRLEQKGLGQFIVLSIHDELVFELPDSEAEALRDRIAEVMTFDVQGIPVLCKPSRLAKRWSDCYREVL